MIRSLGSGSSSPRSGRSQRLTRSKRPLDILTPRVHRGIATHQSEETEMANVRRSVEIKASPEETMALLSDASRWPDWYPGMAEIQVAPPFPEKGGRVTFKVKSAGMSMQITRRFSTTSRASSSFSRWRACCPAALAGR